MKSLLTSPEFWAIVLLLAIGLPAIIFGGGTAGGSMTDDTESTEDHHVHAD